LSQYYPDIALPSATGQNYKAQVAVFDNLSSRQQTECIAWIVVQVEAEQVSHRRNGTARYYVDNSRPPVVRDTRGQGSAVNTVRPHRSENGAVDLQNDPQARMQDLADAPLLGRHIAPAPPGYNHRGAGAYGNRVNDMSNASSPDGQSMTQGGVQSQDPINFGLGQSCANEAFGNFQNHTIGQPLMHQPFMASPTHYNSSFMTQNPAASSLQYGQSTSYLASQTYTGGTPFGQSNITDNSGALPGKLSQGYYSENSYQVPMLAGYLATGEGFGNASISPEPPRSNTFGFQSGYQRDGVSSVHNFGLGHVLRINEGLETRASLPGSYGQVFKNQPAPTTMTHVASCSRKRKQVEEEDEEEGDSEDHASKRAQNS
jgi:hypothetical protein